MSDIDVLRDTLIWAAGGPTGHSFDLDPDDLLDAVSEHRLEARMLRRMRRHGVSAPAGFTRELYDRYHHNVVRVAGQLRLFAGIRAGLRADGPGGGVMPVKGFSLFALTGDMYHVRPSNKLDLIAGNPERAVAVTSTVDGSEFVLHGGKHPFTFGASPSVLVHHGIPVTTFPATSTADAFDPRRHPKVLRVPHLFGSSLITFDDVAAHPADPAVALDGPVCSPEMAALIRCAHCYGGYTMYPDPLRYATIFLDELCQIGDLLALDSFDPAVFVRLVRRHDAALSVAFVRRLWIELLGADPFLAAGVTDAAPAGATDAGQAAEHWFPQDLWWDGFSGFPARLGWDARKLVAAEPDDGGFIASLDAARLVLRRDETAAFVLDPAGDGQLRLLAYAADAVPGPATLELGGTASTLSVSVSLPDIGPDVFMGIGVDGTQNRYQLFYWPQERRFSLAAYEQHARRPDLRELATGDARSVGGRHELTIEAPRHVLGQSTDGTTRLSVRARQQRLPAAEVLQSVIVPLVVSVAD